MDTGQHDHDHANCGHDHHHAPGPVDKTALLSGQGLAVTKGGRAILSSIDIALRPAEIVTLIGPNGAGKTTLVRALLGLETLAAGTIYRQPGLVVGYVPQRFDIDRTIPLTVTRFLNLGLDKPAVEVDAVLSEAGALTVRGRQVAELSGGELQRVILARALLRSPGLLVLDEPSRGVDHIGEAELYALIARLRDAHRFGVLLVSHDLHIVMANADRVICINRHICCSGHPQTVAQHPEYAKLFGPEAARAFAVYTHVHDHEHDMAGAPIAVAAKPTAQETRK